MRLASCENISVSFASLTSLARREKCNILSSLRASQFVSLAFVRLTNKQSHSQREISVRLKILARFSQGSRVKISNDSRESRYKISSWETHKKRFSLRNFVARLAFRDSRYEISVCETHKKWVSLLILTHKSRKNLARILGLKSESRFSRDVQKVILVSTLELRDRGKRGKTSSS
jgi:hypothetical protein